MAPISTSREAEGQRLRRVALQADRSAAERAFGQYTPGNFWWWAILIRGGRYYCTTTTLLLRYDYTSTPEYYAVLLPPREPLDPTHLGLVVGDSDKWGWGGDQGTVLSTTRACSITATLKMRIGDVADLDDSNNTTPLPHGDHDNLLLYYSTHGTNIVLRALFPHPSRRAQLQVHIGEVDDLDNGSHCEGALAPAQGDVEQNSRGRGRRVRRRGLAGVLTGALAGVLAMAVLAMAGEVDMSGVVAMAVGRHRRLVDRGQHGQREAEGSDRGLRG